MICVGEVDQLRSEPPAVITQVVTPPAQSVLAPDQMKFESVESAHGCVTEFVFELNGPETKTGVDHVEPVKVLLQSFCTVPQLVAAASAREDSKMILVPLA